MTIQTISYFDGLAICSQDSSFITVIFLLVLMLEMWTNQFLLRFWQQIHVCLKVSVGEDGGPFVGFLYIFFGAGSVAGGTDWQCCQKHMDSF